MNAIIKINRVSHLGHQSTHIKLEGKSLFAIMSIAREKVIETQHSNDASRLREVKIEFQS